MFEFLSELIAAIHHGLTVVFGPTTTFCVISKNLSGPILNGANLIITVDNIKVAQFILPAS
jgi:hypothetical protein